MCWLDAIILLPLLIGLVRGLMRGLVTEFIAILAVILGCVGASLWKQDVSNWLIQQFTWPQNISDLVAAVLLFLTITIVMNLLGKMISHLLKVIHLGWLNRLAGAVFGTVKWLIIVMFILLINDKIDEVTHYMSPQLKQESITYNPTVKTAHATVSFLRVEFGE